jgi:large subunit ribosomal protein L18
MRVDKRRRRENKTDYLKRLKLLKSSLPEVVFRRTNRYIIAQYVTSKEAQDKIVIGVNSKDLLKYGWPKEAEGSLKSISASYLTGFLIGKKIISRDLENPIVNFGMYRVLHKTRTFAFIKGLKDAGLEIECEEDAIPSEERIKGKHMKNKIPFDNIKQKIEKNK